MADDERKRIEEEKKKKQMEIEKKRAEVRARMEEASKAKKAKKGFMTPERKKKLRLLLRKKAAEELKKEQERKAAERRRIIEERCGSSKPLDGLNDDQVKSVINNYYDRIKKLEDSKFDIEYIVKKKDMELITFWMQKIGINDFVDLLPMRKKLISNFRKKKNVFSVQLKSVIQDYYNHMYRIENQKWDLEIEVQKKHYEIADLNSQVNDLRGKFIKPTLKKVSKYENKFAKLQKKAAEFNFRNQLKTVKKKEFTLEEEDKEEGEDDDVEEEGVEEASVISESIDEKSIDTDATSIDLDHEKIDSEVSQSENVNDATTDNKANQNGGTTEATNDDLSTVSESSDLPAEVKADESAQSNAAPENPTADGETKPNDMTVVVESSGGVSVEAGTISENTVTIETSTIVEETVTTTVQQTVTTTQKIEEPVSS